MMLSGGMVDAAEAERIGLVSATVADAELLPRALAMAREIAANDAFAVWMTKRSAGRREASGLHTAIELENRTQILARTTATGRRRESADRTAQAIARHRQ